MVKSAIKSATKAVTAPAVVKPTKESAKKQKIALKQEVKKKKADTSSSDESSSESEEEQVKAPAKKVVAPVKQPAAVESSSSEEDSSEESEDDVPAPKKVAAKPAIVASKKDDSSSDSDSSSEEEDEVPAPKKVASKPSVVASKKDDSSSDSDSSSEEEDEMPASKKAAAKPSKAAPKKDESSDSSDSDDSSEEEKKPASKKSAVVDVKKKVAADSSSNDESESDSSDEETPAPKTTAAAPKVESDSSESSSDSESDEDGPPKTNAASLKRAADAKSAEEPQKKKTKTEMPATVAKPAAKKAESSSSEDESDDSSDEEPSKAETVKKDNDVEMVDVSTPKTSSKPVVKEFKSPATPATGGSKTLFAGNLAWGADKDAVIEFFKDCGEVVEVRFACHDDGHPKGFGHVEFATVEGARKGLALNGNSLLGRDIRLDLAQERGERSTYTPNTGRREVNSFSNGGAGQTNKVFVRGFDNSLGEDEIKSALKEHFGPCGEISYVSVPMDRETQSAKGIAYVEFSNADGFNKALELDGSDAGGGYYLNVQVAKPKVDAGFDNSGGRTPRGGYTPRGGRTPRGGGGFRGRSDPGGRGRGRTPSRPSMATVGTGKKTVFED